jgi:hypothetical protein
MFLTLSQGPILILLGSKKEIYLRDCSIAVAYDACLHFLRRHGRGRRLDGI